jgi:hypothetical protein
VNAVCPLSPVLRGEGVRVRVSKGSFFVPLQELMSRDVAALLVPLAGDGFLRPPLRFKDDKKEDEKDKKGGTRTRKKRATAKRPRRTGPGRRKRTAARTSRRKRSAWT